MAAEARVAEARAMVAHLDIPEELLELSKRNAADDKFSLRRDLKQEDFRRLFRSPRNMKAIEGFKRIKDNARKELRPALDDILGPHLVHVALTEKLPEDAELERMENERLTAIIDGAQQQGDERSAEDVVARVQAALGRGDVYGEGYRRPGKDHFSFLCHELNIADKNERARLWTAMGGTKPFSRTSRDGFAFRRFESVRAFLDILRDHCSVDTESLSGVVRVLRAMSRVFDWMGHWIYDGYSSPHTGLGRPLEHCRKCRCRHASTETMLIHMVMHSDTVAEDDDD